MTLSPRLATALKGAACMLFLGHMAATCAPHVPAQSALQPLSRAFVPYEELTGTWQSWDMFTTIPYLHAYDIGAHVTESDGTTTKTGVVLPGLRAYDHSVRGETFFLRLGSDASFSAYVDGYIQGMCAALRANSGHGGHTLVLDESYERLRWLYEIRADGVISTHEDRPSRAFVCGD
jgi:hypothetical protein